MDADDIYIYGAVIIGLVVLLIYLFTKNKSLDQLYKESVEAQEVLKLEVAKYKRDAAYLDEETRKLKLTIYNLNSQVTDYQSQVDQLKSQVASLVNQVNTLNSQAASLNAKITELNNVIKSLESQIVTLRATISNLEKENAKLKTELDKERDKIINLKITVDELTSELVDIRPKLVELARYKTVISDNAFLSLQASNALYSTSANSELLISIANNIGAVSAASGKVLCEYAHLLARDLLKSYNRSPAEFDNFICREGEKRLPLMFSDADIHKSNFYRLLVNLMDLLRAYYCNDRTRKNLEKILGALVNVICKPSKESKQLYAALYRQILYDLDVNYDKNNGFPPLTAKYTPGEVSARIVPGLSSKSQQFWEEYTTPGYHSVNPSGDVFVDLLVGSQRFYE